MRGRKSTVTVPVISALLAALLLVPAGAHASAHAVASEVWAVDGGGGLSFSLDASLGALSGDALERVWDGNNKVSELQWDLQGLWMLGLTGTAGITDRFRVNAGYWFALNEGDGKMVDLDWQYEFSTLDAMGIQVTDDDWTDRSEHPDTTVDGIGSFDVNVDIRAFSRDSFHLNGILGFKYDKYEWSARGGTGLYSLNDFRDTPVQFDEGVVVIEYEQVYKVPYFGVGFDGTFDRILMNAYILYSPWVSAEDTDFHVLRNFLAEGDFSGGDYLAVGASGTYSLTDRIYASLAVDYQDYSQVRGEVSNSFLDEGVFFVIEDGGSVALDSFMLSLSAGWRF